MLAGNYAFVSNDPESKSSDHNLNRLALRSDGTYDLIEGGVTMPVSEKKGIWTISVGNPASVQLDQAGYPIEFRRDEVRLLIDLDTGIWWAKPR
jgi:hypothetical protein